MPTRCNNVCERFKVKKPFNGTYNEGFCYCGTCEIYMKKTDRIGVRCKCCNYKVRLHRKRGQNKTVARY